MGEVLGMKNKKKYIIAAAITVIVSLLITLFPVMQEENQKRMQKEYLNETQQALINAGFNEAHQSSDYIVYLDNTETTSIDILNSTSPSIHNIKRETDIALILNAIMPIWDNNFQENGEKIVQEIINSRLTYQGNLQGGNFLYHNYNYSEVLDKSGPYTDTIWISSY